MPPEPMSLHRYSFGALIGDYTRTAIGLLLTLGPLLVTTPLAIITAILAALAALFFAYGIRTVIRHCTAIGVSDKAMEARGPLGTRLAWQDVKGFSLRYFSTKRDRTGGWMQLKVRGRFRAIRVDSSIDGFESILSASARAVRARGLKLDPSTVENLRARGVRLMIDDSAAEAP